MNLGIISVIKTLRNKDYVDSSSLGQGHTLLSTHVSA